MAQLPQSAHAIVLSFLNQFGLGSLAGWAWDRYKQLGGGSTALDTISLEMVDQPQFKARFPAYDILAKRGEAMSPAEMVAYEKTAKQIFHDAGLPQGFYDTPQDLGSFMVNNVSATELKSRVDLAQQAAIGSPPDVRNQLETLYGIPATGSLTAYFLDPTKALPVIQQQFTASQIAADASRSGVGQLTAGQATHLAQLGVSDAGAQSAFGNLAGQQHLFDQQVRGEDQIDLGTQLAATFDNSAAAKLRIRRRQEARLADFQGSSGFAATQTGVAALRPPDRSQSA